MARIAINQFDGVMPIVAPRLVPETAAQIAINCNLERGRLEAIRDPKYVKALDGISFFRWARTDGVHLWINWSVDAHAILHPSVSSRMCIASSTFDYTRVTDQDIYPTYRRLGVPAPTKAPDVSSPEGFASDTDEVARISAYIYTYVNVYGEEGPPSDPSIVHKVKSNATVVVTLHPPVATTLTPLGSVKFRIYRVVVGTNNADYQFLVETTDTLYNDTKQDAELGETCPTVSYDPPPDGLDGLIGTSNGQLIGFHDNEVCFSEPYIPYAWPIEYRIPVESQIIGLGYFGTTIVACTKTRPYIVTGYDPSALAAAQVPFDQPCLSKKSIVSTGTAVYYAGPDGLFMVDESYTGQIVTKALFTRDQWQALQPETIMGVWHNERYYAFFHGSNTGFIYDPSRSDIVMFDIGGQPIIDILYSSSGDCIYLKTATKVFAWGGADTWRSYRWRSRKFYFNHQRAMAVFRIDGDPPDDAMNLCFTLLVDDVPVVSKRVIQRSELGVPLRLPASAYGHTFEIELEGTTSVDEIRVASSVDEVADDE
ncbi:hypothetical protein [Desulfovibrio inopinatus]|uniref:hypothetical protein n=1 Tax=Desulfovibrio inopinatus TaxID=102109 RepID=UPI0004205634|nr:hypothetical protein [Desulfovibrio inopinatus]